MLAEGEPFGERAIACGTDGLAISRANLSERNLYSLLNGWRRRSCRIARAGHRGWGLCIALFRRRHLRLQFMKGLVGMLPDGLRVRGRSGYSRATEHQQKAARD